MDFAAKIKAFEEKALMQADKSLNKFIEALGVENVNLTKDGKINRGGYSDGDIANNWYISVGVPATNPPNAPDLSGSASLARIQAFSVQKLFYRKDNKVFITNVMNYSYRANTIGWPTGEGTNGWVWSKGIGPYGFVQQAISNIKGKY